MQKIDIRKLLKDPSLFREEAFINGQWLKAASGKTFPVNNPATVELQHAVSQEGREVPDSLIKPQTVTIKSGGKAK